MKKKLIFKIAISNLLILLLVLATFSMVNNFLNNKLKAISFQKEQLTLLNSEINRVSSALYQSSSLHDNIYLVKAAISSTKVINILKNSFKIDEIREDYIDFFKYTVLTTSMLLEERVEDAQKSSKISLKKQEVLQSKMLELIKALDKKQSDLILEIKHMVFVSSIFLLFFVIGNIAYLIKTYKLFNMKEEEINRTILQRAAMIDAIGDGVYGVNKNGLCTFINKSALDMLGFKESELLNVNQHYLFHHHKPNSEEYPESECPIYLTNRDRQKRVCNEYFITKKGRFFPVSLTIAPSGEEDVVVVFKDITKDVEILDKLSQKNRELDKLAVTDGLTGLYNRRYFDENFEKEFSRAARAHLDFSVGICDIDYFKEYNDTYGHQKGDCVICAIADVLKNTFNREIDIVARYGGEEFVFVISTISEENTLKLTQKAKDNIESLNIEHINSKVANCITVSFGLVCVSADKKHSAKELLKAADKALYESKNMGRNRITLKKV